MKNTQLICSVAEDGKTRNWGWRPSRSPPLLWVLVWVLACTQPGMQGCQSYTANVFVWPRLSCLLLGRSWEEEGKTVLPALLSAFPLSSYWSQSLISVTKGVAVLLEGESWCERPHPPLSDGFLDDSLCAPLSPYGPTIGHLAWVSPKAPWWPRLSHAATARKLRDVKEAKASCLGA